MKIQINHKFNEALEINDKRACVQYNYSSPSSKQYDFLYWIHYFNAVEDANRNPFAVAILHCRPATKPLAERLAHLPNHMEIIASLRKNPTV